MKNSLSVLSSYKKPLSKNISFCFSIIKKSIVFWVVFCLYILSLPITTLVFVVLNKNDVLNYSFISVIINLSFMIIFLFISTLKLFVESKYSSVDVFLVSKPFKKSHIYISRFLMIFVFVLFASLTQFIINAILTFSFELSIQWIAYDFISLMLINPFIAIFIYSLFILFSTSFKKIWFALSSLIILILSSGLPMFTRSFETKDTTIKYNPSLYNSFEKLTYLDEKNNVKTFIVSKTNFDSIESINTNVLKKINKDNIYSYFVPGEWFGSFYSSLAKDLILTPIDDYSNHSFSLIKNSYSNSNAWNIDKNSLIVLRPNDINPFELTNDEYENLLIKNIKSINYINIYDKLLVQSILDKISENENWNSLYLSQNEINTLKALIGLFDNNSSLFYYWRYYDILKTKTPNLEVKIKIQFSENLWNLMNFVWTSEVAKNNIEISKLFGDIDKIYPNAYSTNYDEPITNQDLNFILKKLIKFNGNNVYYLDVNNTYISTSVEQLQELSNEIIDEQTWTNYVLNNSLTYENANKLINKLKEVFPNICSFELDENYFNPYQYSLYLTKYKNTYLNYASLVVVIVVFATIGVGWLSWARFNKINYKNIEL